MLGDRKWNEIFRDISKECSIVEVRLTIALGFHPGQSKLAGSAVLLLGHRLQGLHELHVAWEVLLGEPRKHDASVHGVEIGPAPDRRGEEPAPERQVADDADPQLSCRLQEVGVG